jgi:hypothetical protein
MIVCDFATAALHHHDGKITVGTPLSTPLNLTVGNEPAAPAGESFTRKNDSFTP